LVLDTRLKRGVDEILRSGEADSTIDNGDLAVIAQVGTGRMTAQPLDWEDVNQFA
jgi:hypothetical protein